MERKCGGADSIPYETVPPHLHRHSTAMIQMKIKLIPPLHIRDVREILVNVSVRILIRVTRFQMRILEMVTGREGPTIDD